MRERRRLGFVPTSTSRFSSRVLNGRKGRVYEEGREKRGKKEKRNIQGVVFFPPLISSRLFCIIDPRFYSSLRGYISFSKDYTGVEFFLNHFFDFRLIVSEGSSFLSL